MANMNTLFKKGYLLAGIMMAANMFVGNEMKAMKKNKTNENPLEDINKNNNNNNMPAPPTDTNSDVNIQDNKILQEKDKTTEQKIRIKNAFPIGPCKYIGFLLQWENTINLVGGALFTFANGLYNFYENKPSFYFDGFFAGWNSNPFARGYLQFCPNINLGRGIFWLVMYCAQTLLMPRYCGNIIKALRTRGVEDKTIKNFVDPYCFYLFNEYTPIAIGLKLKGKIKCDNSEKKYKIFSFFQILLRLLQNFVSVPLIIHLTSEFTISIAFDAIMWMVVTHFIVGNKIEKKVEKWELFLTKVFSAEKKISLS